MEKANKPLNEKSIIALLRAIVGSVIFICIGVLIITSKTEFLLKILGLVSCIFFGAILIKGIVLIKDIKTFPILGPKEGWERFLLFLIFWCSSMYVLGREENWYFLLIAGILGISFLVVNAFLLFRKNSMQQ